MFRLFKKSKEKKRDYGYFTLDEIKVGMLVDITWLYKICYTTIYIGKKNLRCDYNGVIRGEIVYIGDDYKDKGFSEENCLILRFDNPNEVLIIPTIDDIGFDIDLWNKPVEVPEGATGWGLAEDEFESELVQEKLEESKCYTLEELKIGMRVSLGSLSKVYGVRICLDAHTLEFVDGEAFGTIVYIGNGNFLEKGFKQEDVCVILNYEEDVKFKGSIILEEDL